MSEKKLQSDKLSHERRDDLWLGVTPAEWLISGTIGITSAVVAAAAKIRSSFSEEVKVWPTVQRMYAEHSQNLQSINEKYEDKPEKLEAMLHELDEAKEKFGIDVDRVLHKKWGIIPRSEKWFSRDTIKDLTHGTYQRWKAAGANTENKIVFNAIVGMVIGSAATLSFFNGVASRHKIERIEDAVTGKDTNSR